MISCTGNGDDNDRYEPVPIQRLDSELAHYKEKADSDRQSVLSENSEALTALVQILEGDSAAVADDVTVRSWSESAPVTMFQPLADSVFVDMAEHESSLGKMLARAGEMGLDLDEHTYVAAVWGRPQTVIFNGPYAFVALNHYLGADNEAYAHWPLYMRAMKTPEMLVYDIAEAELATKYPYNVTADKDNVLSRALYDGALAWLKQKMAGDDNAARALGFTPEQMKSLAENEGFMWQKLVTGKMLFSTDADLIDRLLSPSPASLPISPDAPGRAVRYTGYRIVAEYMAKYPDTTAAQLLSPDFYANPETLRKSGYSPAL